MDGMMVDNMMVYYEVWQCKFSSFGMDMELEQVCWEIYGVNEEILLCLFGDCFNDEEC